MSPQFGSDFDEGLDELDELEIDDGDDASFDDDITFEADNDLDDDGFDEEF